MSQPIPSDVVVAAKAAHVKYHIPASVSIAQWALESGRGLHTPPGSNNPFGMKSRKGDPSVLVRTREVIHGKSVYVMAGFRKFASLSEAFDEHAKLLATAPVYAKCRAHLPNVVAFCNSLTGVYATDPNYGKTLNTIINGSNLTQYDKD